MLRNVLRPGAKPRAAVISERCGRAPNSERLEDSLHRVALALSPAERTTTFSELYTPCGVVFLALTVTTTVRVAPAGTDTQYWPDVTLDRMFLPPLE